MEVCWAPCMTRAHIIVPTSPPFSLSNPPPTPTLQVSVLRFIATSLNIHLMSPTILQQCPHFLTVSSNPNLVYGKLLPATSPEHLTSIICASSKYPQKLPLQCQQRRSSQTPRSPIAPASITPKVSNNFL